MNKKLSLNQSGVASIIVTVFLVLIMSLIVLGFAQVTRREQRQSLDRQLISQAYYAAESGVNDVQSYIRSQLAAPPYTFTTSFPTCPDFTTTTGISNVIDGVASYSCVLIDPDPPTLVYQDVSPDGAIVVPISSTTPLASVTISWQEPGNGPTTVFNCGPVGTFPPKASWPCQTGGLRVEGVPFSGSKTRANLLNEQVVGVFMPRPGGGPTTTWTPPAPGNPKGDVVGVDCATTITPRYCSVTINVFGATNAFLKIRPLYKSASLVICGTAMASVSCNTPLSKAQAVVDVTGKANDILKRLQVRLPISATSITNNTIYDFAIESTNSLCKAYGIVPPATVLNLSVPPGDPSCLPPP